MIYDDRRFFAAVHFVDANFFQLFDYPLLRGEAAGVLVKPHTMVISRRLAEKVFGDVDPVGAVLSWDGNFDFEVTGVVDVPANSHFRFEILASMATMDIEMTRAR